MSYASRGGLTLKSGKIGRVNCLRQQLMMPGERINTRISGTVKLEALRERESMRINAHLSTFMTPLRWVWPEFTDFIKEGPQTAITPPTFQTNTLSRFGVGSYNSSQPTQTLYTWWRDVPHRIYNQWFKWPESPDLVITDTSWEADGPKAVPLSKAWSRCRFAIHGDDTEEYTVNSATSFDVRTLASKQARYRSMMKRDVLSYNRWMELIKETYDGDGSREVDQVPIMLDQTSIGVNPRELPATDGASLGTWQSLYDFGVDHSIRGIVAPEHCVVSYMLVLRFAPITDGIHPLAANANWYNIAADPEYFSAQNPEVVTVEETQMDSGNTTQLGYLPAGWKWRAESDVIGYRIDELDSFPYMQRPTTQDEAKDATRVKNAFRSERLGDYVADLYFTEDSKQPIGTAMDSYFAGMVDDAKGRNQSQDEFPKGGKML